MCRQQRKNNVQKEKVPFSVYSERKLGKSQILPQILVSTLVCYKQTKTDFKADIRLFRVKSHVAIIRWDEFSLF